jgi:hypothetical protein
MLLSIRRSDVPLIVEVTGLKRSKLCTCFAFLLCVDSLLASYLHVGSVIFF